MMATTSSSSMPKTSATVPLIKLHTIDNDHTLDEDHTVAEDSVIDQEHSIDKYIDERRENRVDDTTDNTVGLVNETNIFYK
ncbi:hypothetical protein NDU88_004939 [Pleurodeles waltl]|uniref:Uncharacterized protein n=1 Tax=Pleurodeles waltl TaxID=8319 RepID=A0AAV7T9J4_PLEWA|nr:hypothetical protein NDU88_004939 [Pleurodeles waltl]